MFSDNLILLGIAELIIPLGLLGGGDGGGQ